MIISAYTFIVLFYESVVILSVSVLSDEIALQLNFWLNWCSVQTETLFISNYV